MKKRGRIVLVTGSSSELGQEVIKIFLDNLDTVYAVSRDRLTSNNKNLIYLNFDINKDRDRRKIINHLLSKESAIDIIINLAGMTSSGGFAELDESEIKRIFDINVFAPMGLIKLALPEMIKQRSGRIINVTSLNGLVALPRFAVYSSSKFALEGFSNALYYEVKKANVYCCTIAVGAIKKKISRGKKFQHRTLRERSILAKTLFPLLSPKIAAQKMYDLTMTNNPPPTTMLGIDAHVSVLLKKLLPSLLFTKLIDSLL
jgi:short-subunit dehydrogenase